MKPLRRENSECERDDKFINGVLKREELINNGGKAKDSDRVFVIKS